MEQRPEPCAKPKLNTVARRRWLHSLIDSMANRGELEAQELQITINIAGNQWQYRRLTGCATK